MDKQKGPDIRVLTSDVANRIAAGEVVERPSSVVKELLENSLDAGATSLRVEFVMGGVGLLSVRDNGHGMTSEQALLAIQRHATSKIRTEADLDSVLSYGFRGEALPSISSVSRLRLTTRTAQAGEGYLVSLKGGGSPVGRPVGAPVGTTVEVADLFFNVPARRKFLKSKTTESRHIIELCTRMALGRPEVAITCIGDGKVKLEAPPVKCLRDRLLAVMDSELVSSLIPIDRQGSSVRVRGVISPPHITRGTSQSVVFVNGRFVKDRLILGAVAGVYSRFLDKGRHPFVALFVEIDPQEVDVNVHPQKLEVRFRNGDAVRGSVCKTISQTLQRASFFVPQSVVPSGGGVGQTRSEGDNRVGESPRFLPGDGQSYLPGGGDGHSNGNWAGQLGGASGAQGYPPYVAAAAELSDRALPPSWGASDDEPPHPAESDAERSAPYGFFSALRYLGQIGARYLVCQGPGGLVVVDQHAAHERVQYERIRKSFLEQGRLSAQHLLIPERVELDPVLATVAEERHLLLDALGLCIEPFGGRCWIVKAIPSLLGADNPKALVVDVLESFRQWQGEPEHDDKKGGSDDDNRLAALASRLEPMWAKMACHGSIRTGQKIAPEVAQQLLQEMALTRYAGLCPHGRPTVVEVDYRELERRFARVK